jgi:hypothetical protein
MNINPQNPHGLLRMFAENTPPVDLLSEEIQALSVTEKSFRCLRIAQLIFRNTVIASDQKTEILANLLMKLPDNDIETIRNLLEDFTVEPINQPQLEKPKPLNRFQILKQT